MTHAIQAVTLAKISDRVIHISCKRLLHDAQLHPSVVTQSFLKEGNVIRVEVWPSEARLACVPILGIEVFLLFHCWGKVCAKKNSYF